MADRQVRPKSVPKLHLDNISTLRQYFLALGAYPCLETRPETPSALSLYLLYIFRCMGNEAAGASCGAVFAVCVKDAREARAIEMRANERAAVITRGYKRHV